METLRTISEMNIFCKEFGDYSFIDSTRPELIARQLAVVVTDTSTQKIPCDRSGIILGITDYFYPSMFGLAE